MLEAVSMVAVLAAPFTLLVYAFLATTGIIRRGGRITMLKYFGGLGIISSIAGICLVLSAGTLESPLFGWSALGLLFRIDSLSMTMMTMIAILGFVIIRFSVNYLDGDPRKNIFLGRLATTIASVEMLVLSGNLFQILAFWVITSVCLHYLLVFYRNRPQAVAAARKKFIVARLADLSLLISFMLIYSLTGTGNLGEIFSQIQSNTIDNGQLTTASIFLVIAAVLKSAQFPTHSWLIEVVETPTPVSALLHAGLLNAGPFLIVRMSLMMTESTAASLMLISIGGLTALFASIIYLTQSSIKVALGYSSIAHMGFSLLICGFGVYSAALLHVVAHSYYKAHSFLSSGSVIDGVRSHTIYVPKRSGNTYRVILSLIASGTVFLIVCQLFNIDLDQNFNLVATGAIIVLGLSQLVVSTIDTKGSINAIAYAIVASMLVTVSFFALEGGVSMVLGSQIPAENTPSNVIQAGAMIMLSLFTMAILIQLFSPRLGRLSWTKTVGIHIRNGLYANVIFDRMIGSLKHDKFKWANLSVKEDIPEISVIEPDLKSLEIPTKH